MPSNTIQPFLARIFPADVRPRITEGWVYGAAEAEIYGGYTAHHAIDFAVPLGTPVLAAADGLAIASFEEVRIRYPSQPRTWHGEPVFWGYGLFIVLLHTNGLLTYYAHLHRLRADIWAHAYVAPLIQPDRDVVSPITTLTKTSFSRTYTSIAVKAGDVIGYSGITGMGIGQQTYYAWQGGAPYRVTDEEHVHFAVSTTPGMVAETAYIDPFALHGPLTSYPKYMDDWTTHRGSLWLA